jgi:hypothetical protein
MKITLEEFDFTNLTDNSVLIAEINAEGKANFNVAYKSIQALKQSGKIPKGTLVLLAVKTHPINLREIPERIMNLHGWVRVIKKIETENSNPEFPQIETPQRASESNHPKSPDKTA